MSTKVLGLDIGGTNFRLGIISSDLRIEHLEVLKSSLIYSSDDSCQKMAEILKDYLDRNDPDCSVKLVSAGFPSLVDSSRRILVSSTNFPGLDGVDIVSGLEQQLGIKTIIEHDAYYLLANDLYTNGIHTSLAVIGLYFGTGLGNAMYLGGKPYIGKHGSACEIGHMPVGMGNRKCSCGNSGCVEMYSCGKCFERLAEEHFPDTPIADVFLNHGDSTVLDEFVHYMAVPVATEINFIDPEAVFIGGGLVYMKGFPKEKLTAYVMDNVRHPYPYCDTKILFSENSSLNGIRGAAIRGFEELFSPN